MGTQEPREANPAAAIVERDQGIQVGRAAGDAPGGDGPVEPIGTVKLDKHPARFLQAAELHEQGFGERPGRSKAPDEPALSFHAQPKNDLVAALAQNRNSHTFEESFIPEQVLLGPGEIQELRDHPEAPPRDCRTGTGRYSTSTSLTGVLLGRVRPLFRILGACSASAPGPGW